mgnify:CR=1 FL=1
MRPTPPAAPPPGLLRRVPQQAQLQQAQEASAQYEHTIGMFRELVANLQADLEAVRYAAV